MSSDFPSTKDLTWQGQRANTCPMDSKDISANGSSSGLFDAESAPGTLSNHRPGMVRPDLPIGSPERAAYFKLRRQTFDEDWEAARIALERANRIAKGDLYFIQCAAFVKIGRTTNIVSRLHNMQTNSPHELNCLLLLKGRGHQESDWHERFRANRVRGEWYRLTQTLKRAIESERFFDGSPLYEPVGD